MAVKANMLKGKATNAKKNMESTKLSHKVAKRSSEIKKKMFLVIDSSDNEKVN